MRSRTRVSVRAYLGVTALLLAFAVLPVDVGVAQASADDAPVWSRVPGGMPEAVTVDAHGSIYVTGGIETPSRHYAMMVARYGPQGTRLWRWTWRVQEEARWAGGQAVAPAPGGGVYAGGASGRGEAGQPVVVRLSASGRPLWRRLLPSRLSGGVAGLASDRHGVIVAVEAEGCCGDHDHDGSLLALDPKGRKRWRTDFEVPWIDGTWDRIGAVALGTGGQIYAAGSVDRRAWSGDGPPPDEDLVVQRLTGNGRERWTRVVDGRAGRDSARATGIAVRGGMVAVTGTVGWGRFSESHAWHGVFDNDGRTQWTDRWGTGEVSRGAVAVVVSEWGPIYVGAVRTRWATTSTLRRYTRDGTLVEERVVGVDRGGSLTGVATSDALYLSIAQRLERWPR